jgi:hypothetical protein
MGLLSVMRAIIAILPLASLLCWLNPTPAGSTGTWTAGLKQPTDWSEARIDGDSDGRSNGREEATTLISAIASALEGMTGDASAHHPGNSNSLPATTLLVDSAVVR